MQLSCEVEFIQTFEDGGQVEGRDLETGEVATYKVYKSGQKYLRLVTGIGDLYFRVEPFLCLKANCGMESQLKGESPRR
jgi:hypothetical protein